MSTNLPRKRKSIDSNSDYTAIESIFQTQLESIGTPYIVKVLKVNIPPALTGTVDVEPLVSQQDANGLHYPQGTIFNVPYLRIQGGNSAIIVDPQVGDIGFIVILGRDHTHFINNRTQNPDQPPTQAPQASYRVLSMSDAIYVGGLLNTNPNQFIQFNADKGISIVSPKPVSIQADSVSINTKNAVDIKASKITSNCDFETKGKISADGDVSTKGKISADGEISSQEDVVTGAISLKTHTHTTPMGPSGPPI